MQGAASSSNILLQHRTNRHHRKIQRAFALQPTILLQLFCCSYFATTSPLQLACLGKNSSTSASANALLDRVGRADKPGLVQKGEHFAPVRGGSGVAFS